MNFAPSVRIIKSVTSDQLKQIAEESIEPVLIKQLVSKWPAVKAAQKSQFDYQKYIEQFDQGNPLLIFEADKEGTSRIFYSDDHESMNFNKTYLTLNDFFSRIQELNNTQPNRFCYMGSTNTERAFKGFTDSNELEFGVEEKICNLWMGNRSEVPAHMDYPENLACCIAGKRTFTLFPPNQLDNLYIGPLDHNPAGPAVSMVDSRNPDFDKYPKYKIALEHSIEIELEPGDVLFLPSMWWHQVSANSDFNVLLNYWWKRTPRFVPSPHEALNFALLTLKDLPKHQKTIWKDIFNYYVFEQADLSHIPEHILGSLGNIDETQARKLRAKLMSALNR